MSAFEGLFRSYPNRIFIETGTFRGHGVEQAIWAAFPIIISIEFAQYWYDYCKEKFEGFPSVSILFGDSGKLLKEVLKDIDCQVTFWLDAHYSEQRTVNGPSPLFKELMAINEHHIRTHTVLIDDISDYDIEEVKEFLSNYKTFQQVENILICQQ